MGSVGGATIYDVATLAGVSISTISRYLNTPDKVNSDTAARITEAMNRLAYIPHGNTGSKSSRRIGRIGVLTPFFPAPSFVQRLSGMTPVFRKNDFEMIVYVVDTPLQLEEYITSIPFTKRLDGLVVMSMQLNEEHSERLARSGLSIVTIETAHPNFPSVVADNVLGGELAAGVFLGKGYEPCAFIGEKPIHPYSLQPTELRLAGYAEALAKAGKSIAPGHILLGDGYMEDARRMARDMLSRQGRPRAVFTMSDLHAIGVLKAAKDLSLRVPEDVAVMGFDDIDAADYMDLSTITQELEESGRVAAELLVGRIAHPDRPRQTINLEVSVIERSTT